MKLNKIKRGSNKCYSCGRFISKDELEDGTCETCGLEEYHEMISEGMLPRSDGTFSVDDY